MSDSTRTGCVSRGLALGHWSRPGRAVRRASRLGLGVVALAAVGCWATSLGTAQEKTIREPVMAGQFYPAEAAAVRAALDGYLADALPPRPDRPIALVVPHAGWIYSGQIAADGFAQAAGHAYDVVVLLGTNHTGAASGRAAVYDGDGFRTPLGVAPIDRDLAVSLASLESRVVLDRSAHAREHSVEVQVPLVQRLFPSARILPIVVGTDEPAVCARVGRALARALGTRRALIVASSDLSHYPAAKEAAAVDRRTLEAIASLDPERLRAASRAETDRGVAGLDTVACGEAPIMVAMAAASALGATRGAVISYANSGDVAIGEAGRVVGYGAVVFTAGGKGADTSSLAAAPGPSADAALTADDRTALLTLARRSLERYLTLGTLPLPRGFRSRMPADRGVFVTLKKKGVLRGCIGRLEAESPLPLLVSRMALESALGDPRFPHVTAAELDALEIEISVLTPLRRVPQPMGIVIGRDGVLMRKGNASAVFLPQVAREEGWDLEETLGHLSAKAGLDADAWRAGASFWTFQADVFRERRSR